ncbi:hypothetical protein PHLGIDRAFT_218055 [Phlebiopsis gigantea 11061_1 CR5-6]|uniref:MYND-type domain-containing protein n=1 Tax=Phlebiopsis gigantea (strain 11061_1 CR5-6) TaxID=745531 RepID=A0A0C3PEK6_PHLG1|nr:hypothetical protein PHLGIDRAFT_218055 [Phlebiopsis gigantea 11061_1 CR5-6]
MSFHWTTNRPDINTARRAWEKSWEDDFTRNYRVLGQYRGNLLSLLPAEMVSTYDSDGNLIQLEHEVALLCQLQQDMARAAAIQFSEQNFEEGWKGLSRSKREEVVLEGIYRTMRLPDMEERRQWCPDSTLNNLASRGGEEYLRILRGLMPETLHTRLTEPHHISHAVIDRLFTPTAQQKRNAGQASVFKSFKTSRTYALTTVIWNIFLAFIGREETQLAFKQPRTSLMKENIASVFPKDIRREDSALRKGLEYCCRTCGLADSMLKDGKKLQACAKCRKIERKVFYCSKECQTKDWREGIPRPHKVICGKQLSGDEPEHAPPPVPEMSVESELLVPPADPGFKRSPALMNQVSRLTENSNVDYVIVNPYPEPDQGIGMAFNKSIYIFSERSNKVLSFG